MCLVSMCDMCGMEVYQVPTCEINKVQPQKAEFRFLTYYTAGGIEVEKMKENGKNTPLEC